MLIFYVDESGDSGLGRDENDQKKLKPGAPRWFILASVGISDTSRLSVFDELRILKDKYFPAWKTLDWSESEIKASYLRQAAKRLRMGKPALKPRQYNSLSIENLRDMCDHIERRLFKKFRPWVYAIVVDKQRLIEKYSNPYSPVGIAYAYLQQRIAHLLDQVLGRTEGAVIVADAQVRHEQSFASGVLNDIRDSLSASLPMEPDFSLLLDKPVWVNPELSPTEREIIQLPDLVAGAALSTCRLGAAPSGFEHLWGGISKCFCPHWTTGDVEDAGFSIYPRPTSSYPGGL